MLIIKSITVSELFNYYLFTAILTHSSLDQEIGSTNFSMYLVPSTYVSRN